MGKVIDTYLIPHASKAVINIPYFGNVVHVEAIGNKPFMWVIQEEEPGEMIPREFGIFKTGETLPKEPMQFLGTLVMDHGGYVLHLFEYLNARRSKKDSEKEGYDVGH